MDKNKKLISMKNKITLLAILFLVATIGYSQSCTNCINTESNGYAASAIGYRTKANANYSFASGYYSEAQGVRSFAFGTYAMATEVESVAIGSFVNSNAEGAFTIGSLLEVSPNSSSAMVIGCGVDQNLKLKNNLPNTLMIGFNSIKPTLFISPSPTAPGYYKTGRIGIGNVTSPQAKLHIYSDDDESATLFLQPSNWTTEYNAEIMLGDTLHSISAEIEEGLVYQTEENHVFRGGNIYIEDIDKGIIMKSPDGRCWLGKLDNNGVLGFEVMESCPGQPNAIFEKGQSNGNGALKVYPNPTHNYLTIEMENPDHELLTVSLLDEKGSELKVSKTTASKTMLYTGDLSRGIYLVKVTGSGRQLSAKVIK